jgi:hypothetical protein
MRNLGPTGALDLVSRGAASLNKTLGAVPAMMRNDPGRVDAASEENRVLGHRGIDVRVVVADEPVGRNENIARGPEIVLQIAVAIGSTEVVSTGR